MCCGKSSGQKKCFLWPYDGVNDGKIRINPHDNKNIIGINTNFDVDIIDIETRAKKIELKNPNRKYYFARNYPQSNSDETLVLSNGELYCSGSGQLIHVFDRLEYMQSGIFSVSENEVIYGQERLFNNFQ
ncbi:hypothetical protein RF11_14074 [Thelohanellus kitauei]|uniref:Uncharacterized protein n=1 Tax=Thelohanellus kitauei TaxID=669202 RepID=A0A0C2J7S1_THEKT|nr:hypothetical protein RF11_14074 [Thelohanellus kitauei]